MKHVASSVSALHRGRTVKTPSCVRVVLRRCAVSGALGVCSRVEIGFWLSEVVGGCVVKWGRFVGRIDEWGCG